jgi:hypothetical protein
MHDEHLQSLKASETITSSSSLSWKLNDLSALHECTDKILQLPTIHQTLARESCERSMGG